MLYGRTHLVMPHISLGAIQKPLKLQAIGVTICYHIAHLAHNCCEDKNANQVANNRKNISKKRKR